MLETLHLSLVGDLTLHHLWPPLLEAKYMSLLNEYCANSTNYSDINDFVINEIVYYIKVFFLTGHKGRLLDKVWKYIVVN